jgi:hypothetical protein
VFGLNFKRHVARLRLIRDNCGMNFEEPLSPLQAIAIGLAGLGLVIAALVWGNALLHVIPEDTDPTPTLMAAPTQSPTASATLRAPTLTPTLTEQPALLVAGTPLPPTPTPTAVISYGPNYDQMVEIINKLISAAPYDVGAAFVDIQTGQAISFGRRGRFHAMSTFKGPLAAYYFWRIEHHLLIPKEQDHSYLSDMLTWSSNGDTACVVIWTGGLEGFNDWLALQGLNRENNFVFTWHSWKCGQDANTTIVPDNRYRFGDAELGLPGNSALLQCPDWQYPCDKAFTPIELAIFYARLYRGEIIGPDSLAQWKALIEKPLPLTSMFDSLPPEAQGTVHAYTKNGFHESESTYRVNFYHEAGILETPYGAFALAVFMQGNPDWRGTDIHGLIGREAYIAFVRAHTELELTINH